VDLCRLAISAGAKEAWLHEAISNSHHFRFAAAREPACRRIGRLISPSPPARAPAGRASYAGTAEEQPSRARLAQCEVSGGLVVIRGVVASYYLKQIAQTIALRVDGVRKVENLIDVQ
jgi:hypothetical protein